MREELRESATALEKQLRGVMIMVGVCIVACLAVLAGLLLR